MKLNMQSIHFVADVKLLNFIQARADKLDTFYDKIIDGEVFLRLDKDDAKQNKVVEIRLNLPGTVLFAKEQKASFEAAADAAIESLKMQVKKHKEKIVEKHHTAAGA